MSIIIIRHPLVALLYQLGLFTRPSGTIEAVQEGQAGAIGIYLLVDHLQESMVKHPDRLGFPVNYPKQNQLLNMIINPAIICDYKIIITSFDRNLLRNVDQFIPPKKSLIGWEDPLSTIVFFPLFDVLLSCGCKSETHPLLCCRCIPVCSVYMEVS